MKFSASQLRTLTSSKLEKVDSLLFYGEEEAFTYDKVDFFLKECLGVTLEDVRLVEASQLIAGEVFLKDLSSTQMLWEESKKAFWVRNANEKVLSLLKEYFEDNSMDAPLIVSTDKYLKPSSKLRQHYEKNDRLVSIGCFAPTAGEAQQKLQAIFQGAGKRIEPSLLRFLAEVFSKNPLLLKTEVEKIILYAGDRDLVQLEDVEACLCVEDVLDYDSLTHAFLTGDVSKTISYFREQLREGSNTPIGVVRMLLAQARRLYALKSLEAEGKTFEQAAMGVSPPVFSHQRAKIRAYLHQWSPKALQTLMEILMSVEVLGKRQSELASYHCERGLIQAIRQKNRLKIS